jgi:hypothetical protein
MAGSATNPALPAPSAPSARNTRGVPRGYAVAAALAIGLCVVAADGGPAAAQPAGRTIPEPPGDSAEPTAGAERQATLVDEEDQRIMQTRAVLTAILEIGGQQATRWKQPQIFGSAHGKTLVLPQRNDGSPYTLSDLVRYGGQYFRRQSDGSYLPGAHIFVADGAKLVLRASAAPLTIRMGSIPGAFSSIVSFGGTVAITGTARNPVRITSWDARTGKPDTDVSDGRAYIRAVGGEFTMTYARVSNLGFWSGRTGGIALTGTDRPASAVKHQNKAQRHEAKRRRLARNKNGPAPGGGSGDIEINPAGPNGPGGTASHVPAANLVTGAIENSTISGDAYGIFVSGSNQTQIINDSIENSLVQGVLMHRFAKNANLRNTTVVGSRGDGFVLSRATEKIRITHCTAERNGGNGFTLNGQALADGPSASGESLESFGDSSVNNSIAKNNGHYGIEVLGGDKLAVQTSQVIGSDMGIVVRDKATDVQISGNQLTGQARQGIALRDGVVGADVGGNTITGAATGIYLRNASGKLVGNTVQAATAHAITLRGDTSGTEITSNTLSGAGTSAVSTSHAHGSLKRHNNNADRWHDTSSFASRVLRYAKPMNIIWACVLLLVVFSMLRSRDAGLRVSRRGVHPYAAQQRLAGRPARVLLRNWHGANPPRGQPDGEVTAPIPVPPVQHSAGNPRRPPAPAPARGTT